ncbi:OsmC family protein [Tunturiibacter empetritectus]|uniref:Organic hydroperoxide reductase OsmC/OhrA n=2 Tax=Tunturiibacter TaxID=3154218 RepID=A0A852VLL3_9BACT|nr:OsmC family protein [Edaphobacter lichenicola]NYF90312.1 organic hydroperoxide reductase OsmC/OhrA [Edaphobacter lichenicola]
MNISARITNRLGEHTVTLSTDGRESALTVPSKLQGYGSSANGGELLFLALATCYCNDIYREAKKRGISVTSVKAHVSGEFGGEGEPAQNITYRASVDAKAPREEILDLMRHTDTVAEIQNTLRHPRSLVLTECEANEI